MKIFNLIRIEYPDFLCEYGFQLIQHVPFVAYLMQTRNIILSAIPSSMARTDLTAQIEKANMQELNELAQNQRNPGMKTQFHSSGLKSIVEGYLSGNNDVKTVVSELMLSIQNRTEKNNLINNSQLIFGLLLFIGQHAVNHLKSFNIKTVRETKYFEFFCELLASFDAQGMLFFGTFYRFLRLSKFFVFFIFL